MERHPGITDLGDRLVVEWGDHDQPEPSALAIDQEVRAKWGTLGWLVVEMHYTGEPAPDLFNTSARHRIRHLLERMYTLGAARVVIRKGALR